MSLDPSALMELVGQVGLAVTLVAVLYYAVFVPRKSKEGERKASLLVPGWLHDDVLAEIRVLRTSYERRLHDEQERADVRVTDYRNSADAERIRRIEAEEHRRELLEAVTGLSRDIAVLLEIARMADRGRGPSSPAPKGRDA